MVFTIQNTDVQQVRHTLGKQDSTGNHWIYRNAYMQDKICTVKVKIAVRNRPCFMQTHTRNIKCFKLCFILLVIIMFPCCCLLVQPCFFCSSWNVLHSHGVAGNLQKDANRAAVVAVTSRAVFELDESDDVCRLGVAHPLLQVTLCLLTEPVVN